MERTDSAIYVENESNEHIYRDQLGDYLGELTDEFDDYKKHRLESTFEQVDIDDNNTNNEDTAESEKNTSDEIVVTKVIPPHKSNNTSNNTGNSTKSRKSPDDDNNDGHVPLALVPNIGGKPKQRRPKFRARATKPGSGKSKAKTKRPSLSKNKTR